MPGGGQFSRHLYTALHVASQYMKRHVYTLTARNVRCTRIICTQVYHRRQGWRWLYLHLVCVCVSVSQ